LELLDKLWPTSIKAEKRERKKKRKKKKASCLGTN
jgi:hypothetical protein